MHRGKTIWRIRKRQPSISPGERPQKEPIQLTPWSQISGPQNCENINFCWWSHQVCGTLSRQLEQTCYNIPSTIVCYRLSLLEWYSQSVFSSASCPNTQIKSKGNNNEGHLHGSIICIFLSTHWPVTEFYIASDNSFNYLLNGTYNKAKIDT